MNGLFGTRWWSWQRLACLSLTFIILAFVFRRIDTHALGDSLAHASMPWFVGALVLYGVALIMGGFRWHVTLHAIRCAVHAGASIRFAFIGHFFYLVFFGAAAGDLARSALYARWFRFGVPELMASGPLDRAWGMVAAIVVGSGAAIVGIFSGGFHEIDRTQFRFPTGAWTLAAALVALAVALLFWRPGGESAWARAWRTLRLGTREFLVSRDKRTAGLGIAIAAQAAMTAVFALNVRAVAGDSLPWLQMAWTFPVIVMLSCVPISVAGAGVREVLAMTFLGLYGVPADVCVAAALLTLACKVTWGFIGGAVLWREATVQQRSQGIAEPQSVSVVIPALNESNTLPATIAHLRQNEFIKEIILVDGGSTDGTVEIANQLGCRVLSSQAGRGVQMHVGAREAQGDVVLLLHADTWLPPHATRALLNCLRDRTVDGGGFWKEFRETPWMLLGSKWKCAVRLWVGRRVAGDQGMFVRRAILEQVGGIPEIALMEEFALCHRLRQVGRLALADAIVLTSARRFLKLGVVRTYLRMWRITVQYWLGTSPGKLRKLYERE